MMKSSYDVIVLGGGINGVGIAHAMAKSGQSVLLIEKTSVGCGASSHSSRLIHGGLRYLEHFNFTLVKEALQDRTRLLKLYPDLVHLEPFYLPVYRNSPRFAWVIGIGLWLYDLFSSFIAPHRNISKEKFTKLFPKLKTEGLRKVFYYYDGKTNDLKLTQTLAHEAETFGCDIITNDQAESIMIHDEGITVRIQGKTIQTMKLVNATGAWIDEVNEKYRFPSHYNIRKVSGIHIVLKGLFVPHPLLLQASAKRIFFVIPERETNQTLIGTTERTETLPCDAIIVNEEDIEYLIKQINVYLKTTIERDDILSSFIGVRPLVQSTKSDNESSREYKLDLHRKGNTKLLHVYGGKLTTFYSLSQKAKKLLD